MNALMQAGRRLGAVASLMALLAMPVHSQAADPGASAINSGTSAVATGSAPVSAVATAAPVANPYGVEALWAQSDLVAKSVLAILAVMSLASWFVIVAKLVEQRRMVRQARLAEKSFWSAGSVRAGVAGLQDGSPFRYIAEAGLEATQKHDGLHGKVEFNEWVHLSIERATTRVQRRLQQGLALLATVGSTSPFIGLFGTVWGIYHALTAIGVAGQASIDKVAGPVGEALIMTAIGLAVAVPAVLGYNWLVRRNTVVIDDLQDFADELHPVLLGGTAR